MDKTRLATLIGAALAAVILVSAVVRTAHPTASTAARGIAFKKGDPDLIEPGDSKRALIGPNEPRWPDYTPEVESYLLRAYPEAEVPGEATLAARNGWASLSASGS